MTDVFQVVCVTATFMNVMVTASSPTALTFTEGTIR